MQQNPDASAQGSRRDTPSLDWPAASRRRPRAGWTHQEEQPVQRGIATGLVLTREVGYYNKGPVGASSAILREGEGGEVWRSSAPWSRRRRSGARRTRGRVASHGPQRRLVEDSAVRSAARS